MKRWLLIAILLTISLVLAYIVIREGWKDASLAYIEQTTGISFSSRISHVDFYDNAESFIAVHLRISEDTDSFVARYGFNSKFANVEPWVDFLKPENRLVPYENDLLFLRGHNANSRWSCVFDPNSKRLWMVVFYPDPAGE